MSTRLTDFVFQHQRIVPMVIYIMWSIYFLLCYPFPTDCYEYDTDFIGERKYTKAKDPVHSAQECQQECFDGVRCKFFTYNAGTKECHMKGKGADKEKDNSDGLVSGPKLCKFTAQLTMSWSIA